MKNTVERLHENRQVELAKMILEANGYEVSKNLRESSIPVDDDCYGVRFFTDPSSGYSEEEVQQYKEEFEIAAEALGTTIDKVLSCSEDNGFESYEYLQSQYEESAEEVRKISSAPGVYKGLYKMEDGTLFLLSAEFGYQIYYFVDPTKS